jgi:phosphatidylglycerophosphate synthase
MNKIKKTSLKIAKKAKEKKDYFFSPIIRILDKLKFTPTKLTLCSLIFGILSAISLQFSKNLFLILIMIAFLFDLLDGALARYQKIKSKYGWWIDFISDRIVMTSIIISTIFLLKDLNYLVLILLFLYLLTNISYVLLKKEYQIIYFEIIYYIIIYIDLMLGTLIALIITSANLLIIITGIIYKNLSKK